MERKGTLIKKWIPCVLFLGIILLFLGQVFLGSSEILGIDGNYSKRYVEAECIESGSSGSWDLSSWLGSGKPFKFKTLFFMQNLFPTGMALTLTIALSLFLALTFMYLFLRRQKLNQYAALFGAIAYALTPHFMTLIYPCHLGMLSFIAYVPMLFYFLERALERESPHKTRPWSFAILSGISWGMMMNQDPQRGIYGSVFAAAYILFLIFKRSKTPLLKRFKQREFWITGIKLALTGIVLGLTFYSNLSRQWNSKNTSGGGEVQKTAAQKWAFSTSWSLHPKELVDSLAPGYHGNISGDPERPYWGSRPVAHSSDSLGFFVVLFAIFGTAAGFKRERRVRFFFFASLIATLLAFGKFMPLFRGKSLFWLWYHLPMMDKFLPGKPLSWLWYDVLMMDKFRVPAKFMSVTAFGAAVLSAHGIGYLMDTLRQDGDLKLPRRLEKGLFIMLGGGLLWFLGVFVEKKSLVNSLTRQLQGNAKLGAQAVSNLEGALLWMILFILLSLGVLFGARKLRDRFSVRPWVGGVFTLLLLGNLLAINMFYLQRSLFNPDEFYKSDEVIEKLSDQNPPFRVTTSLKIEHQSKMIPLGTSGLRNRYLTFMFPFFGIETFDSVPQARVAKDYENLFAKSLSGFPARGEASPVATLIENNLRLWRLCNVKYLLTDGALYGLQKPLPIFEQLKKNPNLSLEGVLQGSEDRQHALFAIEGSLPRVGFYRDYTVVEKNSTALDKISDPSFEIRARAIVTGDLPPAPESSGDAAEVIGQTILEQRRGYLKIETNNPESGLLVWNSRFTPAWRASVDGTPKKTYPADYILTGLPLNAGHHIVEFRFQPENGAFRISAWAVALSLASALAIGAIPASTKKR